VVRAWAEADERAAARRRTLDAQGWLRDARALADDRLATGDPWAADG